MLFCCADRFDRCQSWQCKPHPLFVLPEIFVHVASDAELFEQMLLENVYDLFLDPGDIDEQYFR